MCGAKHKVYNKQYKVIYLFFDTYQLLYIHCNALHHSYHIFYYRKMIIQTIKTKPINI